jgi:hypothetical protein
MAIKGEQIIGTKIHNIIESSNISKAIYDTETKKLLVEFKNGFNYEYEDVPHQLYTQFRMSPSQGKFFSEKISKVFKYRRII